MKKTILGLDLGTNSVGWALVDKENKKILGMGSRIIPMGTDKQDYEKGVSITKNAIRREKRSIRKMSKRYKLRRNKLLFILKELEMLPDQFQFKNGFPEANRIQTLELLPIKRGTLQLDSLQHYQLKVKAINGTISLKELGKILYSFNQLRGYSGGNDKEDTKKKAKIEEDEDDNNKKIYEVITEKVKIIKVEKSDRKFKVKGGKNKGEELFYFDATILLYNEEKEGSTMLQTLEAGKEEELEIRIKQKKNGGENIVFALPQKTNWRKQMEFFEERLQESGNHVSQEALKILEENKWTKARNRVVLRYRYEAEFDAIWDNQYQNNKGFKNIVDDKNNLEKIISYLFPDRDKNKPKTFQTKESQKEKFKEDARKFGLKYVIKEQVIYYQRPLKLQTELISKCQFEKEEPVLATSHPLFQEFRCWDQINRLYITSKKEEYNEKKKKKLYYYQERYLTKEQKEAIYNKLQNQKQLAFNEVAKIVKLENNKTEYLNGLNTKAKLNGFETTISLRKIIKDTLGEDILKDILKKDSELFLKLFYTLFNAKNSGNEYDVNSKKVSSIITVLREFLMEDQATVLALELAQGIKFPRKYGSLSEKAIEHILPLMQLNPVKITPKVKDNLHKFQHLIETGEILDDELKEDYVIEYVKNNPNLLKTGGLMYSFAASLVYGKHTKTTVKKEITNYHDIIQINRNLRNPIVEQIANETMQIVKAIWKEYQFNPDELEIRVELARDLKNSAAEREKIYKGQINNQKINETIKKRLIELKQEPTQGNIDLYKLWSRQNKEEYPKQSKEPTQEEILKLRIWEEQKCISPYTLNPIPLSKLFSPERLYDIDHIIPKSRFFDDSIANKVVCETNINEEKSNRTAWEYIIQQKSKFGICSVEDYLSNVTSIFYGRKKKKLLLEKIPINTVERQIKDTQYISTAVKNELAKIVGSDNVKTTTDEVTNFLRSRWGLKNMFMKLTESRFKQMELWDWNKEKEKPNNEWVNEYFDKEKNKHVYEIKNWSKRFDHRHHSIDALVVALTEQSHIQRLNNLNKYLQDELTKRKEEFRIEVKEDENIIEAYFNLEKERRDEVQRQIESSRHFEKPFEDLVKQAKEHLETMVISHKSKDKLGIKVESETGKKQLKIRAALHQETYYGKTLGRDTKTIDITNIKAKDITQIIDKVIGEEIDKHRKKYESVKEAFTGEGLKAFNENRFQRKNKDELKPPVFKLKIWYNAKEKEESALQRLYDKNSKLAVITGDNYLFLVMEKNGKTSKERVFDVVTLYDSADIAKRTLLENEINYKEKIAEDYRLKHKEKPNKVLFTLQQNELVYLPQNDDDPVLNFTILEFESWIKLDENKKEFNQRIYKVVKFTGKDCFFIPHNYANTISFPKELNDSDKNNLKKKYPDKKIPKQELNFEEFGSFGTASKTEVNVNFIKELIYKKEFKGKKPIKIQDHCIKLKTDWLGNVSIY